MLLKVGAAVMLCSLTLAVVVTADMSLRSEHTKIISAEQQPTAEKLHRIANPTDRKRERPISARS